MQDYEYLYQSIYLEVPSIDTAWVKGRTEVYVAPKVKEVTTIRLHARQVNISDIWLNDVKLDENEYELLSFLDEIVEQDAHSNVVYRDGQVMDLFYRGALVASKEGELILKIPQRCHATLFQASPLQDDKVPHVHLVSENASVNVVDLDQDETNEEWNAMMPITSTTLFQPICIRIHYTLKNPSGGIRFVLPSSSTSSTSSSTFSSTVTEPEESEKEKIWKELQPRFGTTVTRVKHGISPHLYTIGGPFGGLCDGARTWLPCRDNLNDVCKFRLEFRVPLSCIAVASGKMVAQLLDPLKKQRIFRYVVSAPTTASSIGFAIGPFEILVSKENPRVSSFCLPEKAVCLENSTKCMGEALTFYETYLNQSFPFGSFQQVFVYDPPLEMNWLAGASILNQCILHERNVIDRGLTSHLLQVKNIIGSWISAGIGLQTSKDAWVLVGLIEHLVNIYVKEKFGTEEYEYRIEMAIDALTVMELLCKGESPALLSSEMDIYAEYTPSTMAFLKIKSPLIFHMMEQRVGVRHMCKAIQTLICGSEELLSTVQNQLINPPFPSDVNASSVTMSLSTEKATSSSLLLESNQGDGNGLGPGNNMYEDGEEMDEANASLTATSYHVQALSTFTVLRVVKSIAGAAGQDLTKSFFTHWIQNGGMPFLTVGFWYNRKQTQAEVVLQQEIPLGGKFYAGVITVTIVEDTGEFTYQKRLESKRHKWEFPCHSKVRKKRRKRQGFEDLDDSVNIIGPGMGLNDTPVFWLKIDAGVAWLRHVIVQQPDFNWMEQLLSDKQVGGRIQAVRFLSLFHRGHEKQNVMSCRVITECMSGLSAHSHRLRSEAALSLGLWQSNHAPLTNANMKLPIWKGLQNLVRIFKEHFFDQTIDMPLPNYFLPSGGRVVLQTVGDADVAAVASSKSMPTMSVEVEEYAKGEYEIKKAIPRALSLVHAQNGQSPLEIQQFLMQLLEQNDNSRNFVHMDDEREVVEDGFYVGTIILSLSHLVFDPTSLLHMKEQRRVVDLITHYLAYDSHVAPSYEAVVSICALEALCNLYLAGYGKWISISFFQFALGSYPLGVRRAGIESIIRLFCAETTTSTTTSTATSTTTTKSTTTSSTTTTTTNASNASTFHPRSTHRNINDSPIRRNRKGVNDNDVNGAPDAVESDDYEDDEEIEKENKSLDVNHARQDDKKRIRGPLAAVQWTLDFVQTETSPTLRQFAVEALLNALKGLPPSVASDTVYFCPHAHALFIRQVILSHLPSIFTHESPRKEVVQAVFPSPSLAQFHAHAKPTTTNANNNNNSSSSSTNANKHSSFSKVETKAEVEVEVEVNAEAEALVDVVHTCWALLSTYSAYDQRLRLGLFALYRWLFQDETPNCVAHLVTPKTHSSAWATGYAALQALVVTEAERRQVKQQHQQKQLVQQQQQQQMQQMQQQMQPMQQQQRLMGRVDRIGESSFTSSSSTSTNSSSQHPKINSLLATSHSQTTSLFRSSGEKAPPLNPFKGKKVKLKIGETLVRAHKL